MDLGKTWEVDLDLSPATRKLAALEKRVKRLDAALDRMLKKVARAKRLGLKV